MRYNIGYRFVYGITAIAFFVFIANILLLKIPVVLKCGPGSLYPRDVIMVSWDIGTCIEEYPDDPFIKLWHYNSIDLDHAFIYPPSMMRTMMWIEMFILGPYYLLGLIGLSTGMLFESKRSLARFICVIMGGAQLFYIIVYLLWHYYVFNTANYWTNVFLLTTPRIIFPSLLAIWAY